jgi:hypothetical protein
VRHDMKHSLSSLQQAPRRTSVPTPHVTLRTGFHLKRACLCFTCVARDNVKFGVELETRVSSGHDKHVRIHGNASKSETLLPLGPWRLPSVVLITDGVPACMPHRTVTSNVRRPMRYLSHQCAIISANELCEPSMGNRVSNA